MNVHGFFLLYFGVLAAAVAHQFVSVQDEVPEFLTKWVVGTAGAWIGPALLGHWGFSEEGVWFLPEFAGALIAAFAIAFFWKARANAHAHAHSDDSAGSQLHDKPTAA